MKKRPTLGWAIHVIFGWMYRLFVTRPEGQSHLRIHRRAVWGRWWRGMKIPPLLAMFLSKYWLGSPSLTLKIQRHTACRKNLYTFFYLTLNITSGLSLMRKPSKVCVNIGKFYLDFWKNMSFLGLPSSWSKRSTGFFFNESIQKSISESFSAAPGDRRQAGQSLQCRSFPWSKCFQHPCRITGHRGLKWCQSNCQIGKVLGPGFFSGGKCVMLSKNECRFIYIYIYICIYVVQVLTFFSI